MAFGSTLTVTVNAVAKVLNRINQDNYGSEYFLRSSTEMYRMKIRHQKESPNADGIVIDRHNAELTHTVFGTGGNPDTVRVCYVILRVPENDDATLAGYFLDGFTSYVDNATVQSDLIAWLS